MILGIVILVIILVFFFGKQMSKVEHDVKLMRRYGITTSREQSYLANRFGRGNITDQDVMVYLLEKEAGSHKEFW